VTESGSAEAVGTQLISPSAAQSQSQLVTESGSAEAAGAQLTLPSAAQR